MKNNSDETLKILFVIIVLVAIFVIAYLRYQECMQLFNSFWYCTIQ